MVTIKFTNSLVIIEHNGVQAAIPGHMHDQYVVQYANSPYELYAEFGIN